MRGGTCTAERVPGHRVPLMSRWGVVSGANAYRTGLCERNTMYRSAYREGGTRQSLSIGCPAGLIWGVEMSNLDYYLLSDLHEAGEGLPSTVVRVDRDGDILLYREHAVPRGAYEETVSPLRRELLGVVCGYSESSPYCITRDRVRTVEEALEWMAHVGTKRWGTGSTLHSLAKALAKVLRSHQGVGEDFDPILDSRPAARRSRSRGESAGKASA